MISTKNKRLAQASSDRGYALSLQSQRKGMSTVLATVIIVGITVAIGALVWGVISNLVGENLQEGQACFGVFDQVKLNNDYTCYNQTANQLQFSLTVEDIDINGILVSVSSAGASESATLTDQLQTLTEIKNYPSGSCTGNAKPCNQLSSSQCSSQLGCIWDGVKIPDRNAGLTYFFNGITSSPISVSIIPIINGEQCGSTDTLYEIDDCASLLP